MEKNKNKDFNKELKEKFAIDPGVEKFYTKPETEEELEKGVGIIRDIPENLNTPKVLLKLGNPSGSDKFVHMRDQDKRDYVIALPIDKKANHRDIVEFCKKLYKKDLKVLGGGFISTEGDKLIIEGESGDFGKADKTRVAEILQEAFPTLKVEAKENKPPFFVEDPSTEHKEIYESMTQKSKTNEEVKTEKSIRDRISSLFSRTSEKSPTSDIFIGNEKFSFKNIIVKPTKNPYDILLMEKDFNEDTEEQVFYSSDKSLFLPPKIENKIKRVVGLNPIVRIYKDDEGRMKLDGYFD